MISLANPTRFLSLVDTVVPWLTALVVILLGTGLYLSFFVAPPDYQQGETVRIMFIHVPPARLTSMLVLFLLYLGLIALWQAIEEPGRAGRATAVLALVGAINIPIIKFSVDWWNTLHPPAPVLRAAWCKVSNKSPENLMLGMLMPPTS